MEAISTTQQKQCTQEQSNHTHGRNHLENINIKKKQLHYTTLYQNIHQRKGIPSFRFCEGSQSQQVRHTLTGHLATAGHRAQEEHGAPSPRQNKQIVADF